MPFAEPRKAAGAPGYVYGFTLNRGGHLRLSIALKDLILHVWLIYNSHPFHTSGRRTGNAELFRNKQVNSPSVASTVVSYRPEKPSLRMPDAETPFDTSHTRRAKAGKFDPPPVTPQFRHSQ